MPGAQAGPISNAATTPSPTTRASKSRWGRRGVGNGQPCLPADRQALVFDADPEPFGRLLAAAEQAVQVFAVLDWVAGGGVVTAAEECAHVSGQYSIEAGEGQGVLRLRSRSAQRRLLGFLGFVEHKVHDSDDGGPENDLLVPEENLAKMEKGK